MRLLWYTREWTKFEAILPQHFEPQHLNTFKYEEVEREYIMDVLSANKKQYFSGSYLPWK